MGDDIYTNLDYYGIAPAPPKGTQDPALTWLDPYQRGMDPQHTWLMFSASSTPSGNMGQGNYTAGNAYMDALTWQARSDRGLCSNPITMMWGAVAGIGMRWKAFATMDFTNETPEMQFTIEESANVLLLAFAIKDIPEWWGMMPPVMLAYTLQANAGGAPQGYDMDLFGSTAEDPLGVSQTFPREAHRSGKKPGDERPDRHFAGGGRAGEMARDCRRDSQRQARQRTALGASGLVTSGA